MDRLINIGFEETVVAEALKQTDNDEQLALDLLTQHPELLIPQNDSPYVPSKEDIDLLINMGYTESLAKGTLKKTKNIENAIELLINGNGVEDETTFISDDMLIQSDNENEINEDVINEDVKGDENNENIENNEMNIEENDGQKDVDTEKELFGQLGGEDDDVSHLDIDLTEEKSVIDEYKLLILEKTKNDLI